MGIKTFLDDIGKDAKKVFTWLGSSAGQNIIAGAEAASVAVATDISPAAGLALSGAESLVNAGLKQVVATEAIAAAAGQQTGTGTQKTAAVTQAVTPQISTLLQSLGVKSPTATQIQNVGQALSTGLVTILNSLPSTSEAPSTAAAVAKPTT